MKNVADPSPGGAVKILGKATQKAICNDRDVATVTALS